MAIDARCPHCDAFYKGVPDQLAGKMLGCRRCSQQFLVEALQPTATQPSQPAQPPAATPPQETSPVQPPAGPQSPPEPPPEIAEAAIRTQAIPVRRTRPEPFVPPAAEAAEPEPPSEAAAPAESAPVAPPDFTAPAPPPKPSAPVSDLTEQSIEDQLLSAPPVQPPTFTEPTPATPSEPAAALSQEPDEPGLQPPDFSTPEPAPSAEIVAPPAFTEPEPEAPPLLDSPPPLTEPGPSPPAFTEPEAAAPTTLEPPPLTEPAPVPPAFSEPEPKTPPPLTEPAPVPPAFSEPEPETPPPPPEPAPVPPAFSEPESAAPPSEPAPEEPELDFAIPSETEVPPAELDFAAHPESEEAVEPDFELPTASPPPDTDEILAPPPAVFEAAGEGQPQEMAAALGGDASPAVEEPVLSSDSSDLSDGLPAPPRERDYDSSISSVSSVNEELPHLPQDLLSPILDQGPAEQELPPPPPMTEPVPAPQIEAEPAPVVSQPPVPNEQPVIPAEPAPGPDQELIAEDAGAEPVVDEEPVQEIFVPPPIEPDVTVPETQAAEVLAQPAAADVAPAGPQQPPAPDVLPPPPAEQAAPFFPEALPSTEPEPAVSEAMPPTGATPITPEALPSVEPAPAPPDLFPPAQPDKTTVDIICPKCGLTSHNAPVNLIGRNVKCRKCGHSFPVKDTRPEPQAATELPEMPDELLSAPPPPEPVAAAPVPPPEAASAGLSDVQEPLLEAIPIEDEPAPPPRTKTPRKSTTRKPAPKKVQAESKVASPIATGLKIFVAPSLLIGFCVAWAALLSVPIGTAVKVAVTMLVGLFAGACVTAILVGAMIGVSKGGGMRIVGYLVMVPIALTWLATGVGSLILIAAGPQPDSVAQQQEPVPIVPTPVPTSPPIATPVPETSPTPQATPSALGTREELQAVVEQIKQAIDAGDYDKARRLLSRAALIDDKDPMLLRTARDLVNKLIAEADLAARNRQQQRSKDLLNQARRVAFRFGFNTEEIDQRLSDIRASATERVISPSDTSALNSLIGQKVSVKMKNGETKEGTVKKVTSSQLILDAQRQVGAGQVAFTLELSRSSIESVHPR